MGKLHSLEEVKELIKQDRLLVLAGPKSLLEELPVGRYIAGSCYYFINEGLGLKVDDKIAVYDLTGYAKNFNIVSYNEKTLRNIYEDAYDNGFSYIITPYQGSAHMELAINLPYYDDFATKPLYGFVSGVIWEKLYTDKAIAISGLNNLVSNNDAVVLHVELSNEEYAEVDIVDPFEADLSIKCQFNETGFLIKDVYLNNKCVNFASFLSENKKDLRFPLICTDFGAKVNVSFIEIKDDKVVMASPVFKGATYYFAKPVEDYSSLFKENLQNLPTFSCNCVLNYQYMGLQNSLINNHFNGPTTYGEIAYRLLNQTIANLYIKKY